MTRAEEKQQLLKRSREIMVGGVNSPVRAFGDVDCDPVIVTEAKGAYVTDMSGEKYIDYVCSYGPLIFGHAPEHLLTGVAAALAKGTTYGFTTPSEVELAELIIDAYPGCDKVRMVNSGTEATMSAIRAARGFTGRDKILKFEGCYHGHSDSLLVKSGSGLLTQNVPTSKGIVRELIEKTLVCPYNDLDALKTMIEANKGEIACVIIEPVAGNMGVLPPDEGYLAGVRELTAADDIILIFDEVITGFRVGYHSAAGLYDIVPDMVCFGKIIGGGLPVGAYGGRDEIMKMVAPLGPVYQGGTLSGNPLAMAAGIANLKLLRDDPSVYEKLEQAALYLDENITSLCAKYDIPAVTSRIKGMFCLFFNDKPVHSYRDVMNCDCELYKRFFEGMIKEGVLLAPSQFEAWFPSAAHDREVLEKTITAVEKVFSRLK